MKIYSNADKLPQGEAPKTVTEGCLVLEGGAWRGIYTQGALDALMEEGINFQTVTGISAGAMSGLGYVSGQIGFSGRINLTYRHDKNYCGLGAYTRDSGVTGFSYFFNRIMPDNHFDISRFADPRRRFVVAATNCHTGEAAYFEKGSCDIFKAVQASATVPYASKPVDIDGTPYLDGGCATKIPYQWAKDSGFSKIFVIRTRDRTFRKEESDHDRLNHFFYRKYPKLEEALAVGNSSYNKLLGQIEDDERTGRTFVLAPKKPVEISRFEGDMEALGELYWNGYNEMREHMEELKEYLAS